MPNIQLVAVGRVEPAILDYLALVLPESAGGRATLSRQAIDPREAFDPARQQFHSTWILTRLADLARNDGERVVGVADVDLFIPIFTFVFGEAQLGERRPSFPPRAFGRSSTASRPTRSFSTNAARRRPCTSWGIRSGSSTVRFTPV